MQLVVVRHAEAAPGDPDEVRALTEGGRRTARRLGEHLARDGVHPDAILTSPLRRALETGEELAKALGVVPQPDDRLAPGASAEDFRAAVAERGASVVVVGHQPDCGRAVAALTGAPAPAFPPGGMAVVEI